MISTTCGQLRNLGANHVVRSEIDICVGACIRNDLGSSGLLFQALTDPTPLHIMGLLLTGDVCVCDIHEREPAGGFSATRPSHSVATFTLSKQSARTSSNAGGKFGTG
jgi:hypothetical protein